MPRRLRYLPVRRPPFSRAAPQVSRGSGNGRGELQADPFLAGAVEERDAVAGDVGEPVEVAVGRQGAGHLVWVGYCAAYVGEGVDEVVGDGGAIVVPADLDAPEPNLMPVDAQDRRRGQGGVGSGTNEEVCEDLSGVVFGPGVAEHIAELLGHVCPIGAGGDGLGQQTWQGLLGVRPVAAHEIDNRSSHGLRWQTVDDDHFVCVDRLSMGDDAGSVDQSGDRAEGELEGLGGRPVGMEVERGVVANDIRPLVCTFPWGCGEVDRDPRRLQPITGREQLWREHRKDAAVSSRIDGASSTCPREGERAHPFSCGGAGGEHSAATAGERADPQIRHSNGRFRSSHNDSASQISIPNGRRHSRNDQSRNQLVMNR